MGTNYYLHEPDTNHCSSCGRFDAGKVTHIGKSSGGWCFALHVTDEIRSLDDWKAKFSSGVIRDEYDREVSPEEMIGIITERSRDKPVDFKSSYGFGHPYPSMSQFLEANHAELGPEQLLRHRIGQHCVGHGEGTWDLIPGEFS